MPRTSGMVVGVLASMLTACSTGGSPNPDVYIDGGVAGSIPQPVPAGPGPSSQSRWHWQLDGTLNLGYNVEVYDLDLDAVSDEVYATLKSRGIYLICYFSAGSYEDFRADEDEFSASRDSSGRVNGSGGDLGRPLDPPFGEERWLDIRSQNVRRIMEARLDRAAARGCDAVEPDNVDGYLNDNGLGLTAADQVDFNSFIANAARSRGMAVGLKNDLDQIPTLVDYFDFAVNEQCHEFDECAAYGPFLDQNKAVFNAEYAVRYRNNTQGAREQLCDQAQQRGLRTLVLPIELDDRFRFSCDP